MKKKEITKLDNLWKSKVKDRAGWRCEYCGKEVRNLNAHHIYSRTCYGLRWNINNGVALCPLHHTLGSVFSAHKTPAEFMEWIVDKRDMKLLSSIKKAYEKIGSTKPKRFYQEEVDKLNGTD